MPAPAVALLAGVFGRVEPAARALAVQAVLVDRADRADLAGTVARADQTGMVVQADTVGLVVDSADSRAETPSGSKIHGQKLVAKQRASPSSQTKPWRPP